MYILPKTSLNKDAAGAKFSNLPTGAVQAVQTSGALV
jgi:hypothetical protein